MKLRAHKMYNEPHDRVQLFECCSHHVYCQTGIDGLSLILLFCFVGGLSQIFAPFPRRTGTVPLLQRDVVFLPVVGLFLMSCENFSVK